MILPTNDEFFEMTHLGLLQNVELDFIPLVSSNHFLNADTNVQYEMKLLASPTLKYILACCEYVNNIFVNIAPVHHLQFDYYTTIDNIRYYRDVNHNYWVCRTI